MARFNTGDKVELNSGGPPLTVVTPDGDTDSDVKVAWFSGGGDELAFEWLPVDAVKPYEESQLSDAELDEFIQRELAVEAK